MSHQLSTVPYVPPQPEIRVESERGHGPPPEWQREHAPSRKGPVAIAPVPIRDWPLIAGFGLGLLAYGTVYVGSIALLARWAARWMLGG